MRTRLLKPSFFTNDRLAELDPLARLLFQGLWCYADREGRLEYRPKKLKAEILPYDDCELSDLIGQLSAAGFIVCYSVDGSPYIAVVNFTKHQKPHHLEAASALPAPAEGIVQENHDDVEVTSTLPQGHVEDTSISHRDQSDLNPISSALTLNPSPLTCNLSPKDARERAVCSGDDFDRFWEAYPEKVGKPAARRAWRAAALKARIEDILAGLQRYKAQKPPDRAYCNPATFLNQERWNDQPAPNHGVTNGRAKSFDFSNPLPEHRTPKSPPPSCE